MSRHFPRRLRGDEALYLYLETPRSAMNVGLIAEVDGEIDGDVLASELEQAVEQIPPLRCRVQPAPAGVLHPRLSAEEPFVVTRHLHTQELENGDEVDAVASEILAPHLDRQLPLWQLHLLQIPSEQRSVLVFKAHRSVVDEPSGMALFSQLARQMNHDRQASQTPEPIFHEIGRPIGPEDILQPPSQEASMVRELLRGGLEQLLGSFDWLRLASESNRLALRTLADVVPDLTLPVKRLPFNRLGSGKRQVARLTLSYAEARAIRQTFGGSIGDVSLAVVTSALARALGGGSRVADSKQLRLLCPLSTQFLLEDSTVATTYLPLSLPLSRGEIGSLYRAVRAQTRTLRAARVPQAIREALEVLTDWPAPTVAQLARAARFVLPCNALFTQVAGPQVPLRIQDLGVRQIHPIHSLLREHGLGFSSLSYNQRICIGITSDQLAFTKLADLCDNVESSMTELKRAADVRDMSPIEVGRPRSSKSPESDSSSSRRSRQRPA